jgi:S-formylglutathione hydrolase FrmB
MSTPSTSTTQPRHRIGRGHVTEIQVPSADTDVPVRTVWVYRPDVPDSATLPVVYFLHGVPGSAFDVFQAGAAAVLDRMFASGVPPFVVASPTGFGKAHADTEWADSVDGLDKVETYLVNRVIPAVEGANRRDRNHRVIAGFSMGGYGAANLALRHTNLFASAAVFAGYFHIDDPDEVFGRDPAVEAANDPDEMITHVHDVQFWLADGTEDREPVVQGEAVHFAKLAGSSVAPGDLVLAPGTHSFAFVLAHFPDMGHFVARVTSV